MTSGKCVISQVLFLERLEKRNALSGTGYPGCSWCSILSFSSNQTLLINNPPTTLSAFMKSVLDVAEPLSPVSMMESPRTTSIRCILYTASFASASFGTASLFATRLTILSLSSPMHHPNPQAFNLEVPIDRPVYNKPSLTFAVLSVAFISTQRQRTAPGAICTTTTGKRKHKNTIVPSYQHTVFASGTYAGQDS